MSSWDQEDSKTLDSNSVETFSSIPLGTHFWGEDGHLYEKVNPTSAGQIVVHVDGSRRLDEPVRFYAEEKVKLAASED